MRNKTSTEKDSLSSFSPHRWSHRENWLGGGDVVAEVQGKCYGSAEVLREDSIGFEESEPSAHDR